MKSLNDICERFGLDQESLDDVAVLILPENVSTAGDRAALHDVPAAIRLAKHLKAEGIRCKTAYHLGLEPRLWIVGALTYG